MIGTAKRSKNTEGKKSEESESESKHKRTDKILVMPKKNFEFGGGWNTECIALLDSCISFCLDHVYCCARGSNCLTIG